jgi:PAS domain S-box-containing protein
VKKKILIVDDTPGLLKLGKAIFESGGFDVLAATDGVEALELLAGQAVDLIITDILMPNMDGYSLCHNIRNNKKNKDTPIIVYSATYTSQSDEELAIDIGADMFIRKPASSGFLLDAANNLISHPKEHDKKFSSKHDLSEVMRQYSSRLIEKLEVKNQELEIANTRLLFHIENTPLGFIEWDEQLCVKSWSKRAEEIFGWTEQEFISLQKDGYSQVYTEDLPWLSEIARQLLTGAVERNTVQHRNYTKDGRVIWCEWFNSVLKNKDGKVITILSLVQDITERKKTEDKVKHSELRLKQAQEIAHCGSWEKNLSTGIATWSEEACRIYGLSPEDNIQSYQSWVSFIHPDDLDRVMKIKEEEKTLGGGYI